MKPDRNGHYRAEDWRESNPGYQYTQPRHHKMLCGDGVVRQCVDVDGGLWFDIAKHNERAELVASKRAKKA